MTMISHSACSAVTMKMAKKLKALKRLQMAKIETKKSVKMLMLMATQMPIRSLKTTKRKNQLRRTLKKKFTKRHRSQTAKKRHKRKLKRKATLRCSKCCVIQSKLTITRQTRPKS